MANDKPMIEHRQYQMDSVNAVANAWESGKKKVVLVLPTGSGKCLGRGTPVLMFDGRVVPVESVSVGDLLMGPDSLPRRVMSLARGEEMMCRVTPVKGDAYTVNESHILSLKMSGEGHRVVNLSVRDYLSQTNDFRRRAKGYRVGVEFPASDVPLDPYFLGLWLADGTTAEVAISKPDEEVRIFLAGFASQWGLNLVNNNRNNVGKCPTWRLSNPTRGANPNPLKKLMRKMGLIGNKHMPMSYKCNSRAVRLEVLAGLMDGDGSLAHGGYDYCSTIESLANDVAFVARSLGLAAYVKRRTTKCQTGATCVSWRVSISGDTDAIPCRIARKKAPPRTQKKDVLVTGITVEAVGVGEYFGFTLAGDGLFMLGDFTVTHNTNCLCMMTERLLRSGRTMAVLCHRRQLCKQIAERMMQFDIPYKVEMADLPDESWVRDDPNPRVWVASKDTLLSRCANGDFRGLPASDMICIDECVVGETMIETENGRIRIDEVPLVSSRYVLSYGPHGPRFRRIAAFLERGKKKCLKFRLANGSEVVCTSNHPVMTRRGWVEAGKLLTTDLVRCTASADAERGCGRTSITGTTGWQTGTRDSRRRGVENPSAVIGLRLSEKTTSDCAPRRGTASAGVVKGSSQPCPASISSSVSGRGRTNGSCGTTRTDPGTGSWSWNRVSDPRSSEPCSETRAYCTLTGRASSRGSRSTTQSSRPSGRSTSGISCTDWCGGKTTGTTSAGTEDQSSTRCVHACRPSSRFTTCATTVVRSESPASGWTNSVRSGWRGGSAMTDRVPADSTCTPRGTRSTMLISSPSGSVTSTDHVSRSYTRGSTRRSTCEPRRSGRCSNWSIRSCPSAWGTSWSRVVEVSPMEGDRDTFDLTVDDDHNFFANGVLVHNCHRVRGIYRTLAEKFPAKWWVGLTATPIDGKGNGLGSDIWDAMVSAVTVRQLTDMGHLVPLKSYTAEKLGKRRRGGDRSTGIAGDPLGNWLKHAEGRPTIGFSSGVKEAGYIADLFTGAGIPATVLTAKSSFAERTDAIGMLKDGKLRYIANAFLFGEGVDIPELGCIQLMRKCGSLRDLIQIVGRVLRPSPSTGKEYGILIDHSGAMTEFMYPKVEIEWSLGATEESTDAQLERKKKELGNPVECGNCHALFAGTPKCPYCGWVIPPSRARAKPLIEREVLVEVDTKSGLTRKSMYQKQWEDRLWGARTSGITVKRAALLFYLKTKKWPSQAGVTPVYGRDLDNVLVRDLWPRRVEA